MRQEGNDGAEIVYGGPGTPEEGRQRESYWLDSDCDCPGWRRGICSEGIVINGADDKGSHCRYALNKSCKDTLTVRVCARMSRRSRVT